MGDTERPIPERDGDQEAQAQQLVRTGNGPTVDNESELLAEQYGPADMAGYHSLPEPADQDDEPGRGRRRRAGRPGRRRRGRQRGGRVGMTVDGMIAQAEKSIGLREPNAIQQWYRQRNGSAYAYNFPWCNAAVTYWATQAGEREAVLFGTDYAYTVAHAQRFKAAGQRHAGAKGIRRGDIVFFDWGGTNEIAKIDHVGIVTGVSGSHVYTIEGNTANVCARRVRTEAEIAGYGRPKYKAASGSSGSSTSTSGTYKVKAGNTLSEIAAAHGTTVTALASLNGISNPNKIAAGKVLKLPARTSTAKPVVSLAKLVRRSRPTPRRRARRSRTSRRGTSSRRSSPRGCSPRSTPTGTPGRRPAARTRCCSSATATEARTPTGCPA